MSTMQSSAVRDLEQYGLFMSERTTRSLVLLREIERTVVALGTIRDEARSFNKSLLEMLEDLKGNTSVIPEDMICTYAEVQDHLENIHSKMQIKLGFAKKDRDLRDDDGVCEIYREAMSAVHDLHDCIEDFRWGVMQHNAKLDESDPGRELTSTDEVEAFLASL